MTKLEALQEAFSAVLAEINDATDPRELLKYERHPCPPIRHRAIQKAWALNNTPNDPKLTGELYDPKIPRR